MTRRATLLDVDYTMYNGYPVIRLWVAEGDRRYQVVDGRFRPYFWLRLNGEEESDYLRRKVYKAVNTALSYELEGARAPVRLEEGTRKWYGKEVPVLRVQTTDPRLIPMIRGALKQVDGVAEVLEATIKYPRRWMLDNGVQPSSLIEFTGREVNGGVQADSVKTVGPPNLNDLRLMVFDLEVWNKGGFPSVDEPITILTMKTNRGHRIKVCAELPATPDGKPNDYNVCKAFLDFWNEFDPDGVGHFNGDNFDWVRLLHRLQVNGLPAPTGRDGRRVYVQYGGHNGEDARIKITGVFNVDLYRVAKRDLLKVKNKSLDAVAEHFEIPTYPEWTEVPADDMWAWFLDQGACTNDPEKRCENCPTHHVPGNRARLEKYAETDTDVTMELMLRLLPLQAALSRYTYIPLGEIAAAPRGEQCEYYLIRRCQEIGELVPNKPPKPDEDDDDDEEFEGATVLEPVAGLHEDVTGFDFKSLYPTIMDHYNVSPEVYAGTLPELIAATGKTEEELATDYHIVPELPPSVDGVRVPRHCFHRGPDGFLRDVVRTLISERSKRKTAMDNLKDTDPEYAVLDVEQEIIKVLTNSMYGYTGWVRSRWFFVYCAESVTAWGRWMILALKDEAERRRTMDVIYGDTDSVFVRGPREEKVKLAEWANANLPVKVDAKENYKRVFFPGPKKRYVGLNEKPDAKGKPVIVIKGLETKRGDWSLIAQAVQKECIHRILLDADPSTAAKFARETVKRLQTRNFSLKEVTIRKGFKKEFAEYKTPQGHIEALKRAMAQDPQFKINLGDKISYIVLEKERPFVKVGKRGPVYGPEPALHERTCVVSFWDGKQPIDVNYYVRKQVVPAAMRLLDFFGYDEDYFCEGQRATKLKI